MDRTWAFTLRGEQITGLACILLGLVIALLSRGGDEPPPRAQLQAASGKLAFVELHGPPTTASACSWAWPSAGRGCSSS